MDIAQAIRYDFMDYSRFIEAVKNGNQAEATRLCEKIIPVLQKYLIFVLNATAEDADDAVQMMFEYVIGRIQNGKEFKNPDSLMSYMLIAVRHNYVTIKRNSSAVEMTEFVKEPVAPPNQLDRILSEERMRKLESCVNGLSPKLRDFIQFWFDHPDAPAISIAERFGVSESAVWTKKHRILKKIHNCMKENGSEKTQEEKKTEKISKKV